MPPLSTDMLTAYWSMPQIEINIIILMNIVGSLLLGMVVGYERSYHGRAAGMRTYGLVCMASSAITVIVGFPHHWFGGLTPLTAGADPTRVIQGVVTGIGFLGAGVIMKEGLNISGLTTAASIWASSAIGILCGSGFYLAAIILTLISSAIMIWAGQMEMLLPSRHALSVSLSFHAGYEPHIDDIKKFFSDLNFDVGEGSITVRHTAEQEEWRFVIIANTSRKVTIQTVVTGLKTYPFLNSYYVAFARN